MSKQISLPTNMSSDIFHESVPTNSSTECHSEHSSDSLEDPQGHEGDGVQGSRIHGLGNYKDTIYENLKCIICDKVPIKALQCRGCDSIACASCIKKRKGKNKCPTRCTNEKFLNLKKTVRNLLESLVFDCRNQKQGCSQLICYQNLTDHENNCEYSKIQCIHCATIFFKKEISIHIEKCSTTLVNCSHGCLDLIMKKDIEMHDKTCPLKRVMCVECHAFIRRSSIKVHQEIICPDANLPCSTCEVVSKRKEGHNCVNFLNNKIEEAETQHEKKISKQTKLLEKKEKSLKKANKKVKNLESELIIMMEEVKKLRKASLLGQSKRKNIFFYKSKSDKIEDTKTRAYFTLLEDNY